MGVTDILDLFIRGVFRDRTENAAENPRFDSNWPFCSRSRKLASPQEGTDLSGDAV